MTLVQSVVIRAMTRDGIQSEIKVQPHNHKTVMRDSRCESLLFRLSGERGSCQNAGILLDNRRGMDLRANNNFGNSDGKMGNELLCLVDRWGLGLSL